ncbi:MAG: type II secretion system ATPase GspE [Candidatus Saganbacteria bacterium]|nr:type II secretion system ATPase GspE [Candidatus Saganbacteria bacterium]
MVEDKKDLRGLTETLIAKKIITPEQLQKALDYASTQGIPVRRALLKLKYISEDHLLSFYQEQLGIPSIALDDFIFDETLLLSFPEELAQKHIMVPLFKTNKVLTVAISDPLNILALDEAKMKTGMKIEAVASKESSILSIIDKYYQVKESVEEVIGSIKADQMAISEEEIDKLQKAAEEAPIIKLVNLIIKQSVEEGASDVHIEPEEKELRVRYRVDGILHDVFHFPKHLQLAIISRIKIMSNLNIAVKRSPQDGRIGLRVAGKEIDIRVSCFPTDWGENVVLRILDASSILIPLESLGFNPENLEKFSSIIKMPHGILLVTGPTGSGKTTTLYSALNTINTVDKNIITVEDPIEYHLPGVRQSQVDPKAGLTFASGLRSILRQDPDVIMVGEIRDGETAAIAVQAALTGHLVFSTLHTNDAPGGLTRLVDMGVEPFLISSSVIAILAQRLVRRVCRSCKQEFKPDPKLLAELGIKDKNMVFFQGKGCPACKQTGYKGRLSIFEFMLINDEVRDLIMHKASSAEIKASAQKHGMKTLREDGLVKVASGFTSLEEVLRVTGDV